MKPMLSPVAFIIQAAPWRLQIRGESVRRTVWGQALQWLVLETKLDNKEMKTEQTHRHKRKSWETVNLDTGSGNLAG